MIAILILAGGQSSRMGSPKALLPLSNGQTLLDFHINTAKAMNVPILIADNGKGYYNAGQQGVYVIDDYLPSDDDGKGQGALSAIMSAFTFLNKTGYVLVIGCDTLLNANDIAHLLNQTTAQVGYLKGKKDHPLLAMYHSGILPQLKEFLHQGGRSVMQFLTTVECQTIALDDDYERFANVNTKDDFKLALESINNEFDPFNQRW